VKRLVPFHHDPSHDDDLLDQIFAETPSPDPAGFDVVPAREGATFEL
jgi:hypothetical protein